MNQPNNQQPIAPATRRRELRTPKPGPSRRSRTLATLVELVGTPLRAALHELKFSNTADARYAWERVYQPRITLPLSAGFDARRASRQLVAVWMTAARFGQFGSLPSLIEAEAWFRGEAVPPCEPWLSAALEDPDGGAVLKLRSMSLDEQTADLLPYLLEPFQRGSRLSVRRDATHVADRAQKKAGGVFYTPADVAEHMCKMALAAAKRKMPLCLDPACGTGVFLRCLLRRIAPGSGRSRLDTAAQCLFGFDVDPAALDAAAFVLLWDCLAAEPSKVPNPWAAWHRMRMNLLDIDSLTVVPAGRSDQARRAAQVVRQMAQDALAVGRFTPSCPAPLDAAKDTSTLFGGGWGHRIDHLLPEAANSFDVYVANPPYSPIGDRHDAEHLRRHFAIAADRPVMGRENIYPFFVEQMWRLTNGRGSGALVLPLSIAFHRGERFRAVRREMAAQDVTWRCSFYDREPHALFGEDVKTRNAIITMHRDPRAGRGLYTGPLKRWTSRTRADLFGSPRHVRLDSVYEDGIPKLADVIEQQVYDRLHAVRGFGDLVVRVQTASPAEATGIWCGQSVHLASTAYNFLNVFPSLPPLDGSRRLSENPVHRIVCADEDAAWAVYACLSSQLAFWTWYVRGDGFHVPRWFIEEFPAVSSLNAAGVRSLSLIGQTLWEEVRHKPIVSHNKGRYTLAFPQLAHGRLREQADRILLEAAGASPEFACRLRRFLRELVVLDSTDAARSRLAVAFAGESDE